MASSETQFETARDLVDRFLPVEVLADTPGLVDAVTAAVAIRQAATAPEWSGLNAGRQATLLAIGSTCSTVPEAFSAITQKAKLEWVGERRGAQRQEFAALCGAPVEMLDRWADHRPLVIELASFCVASARRARTDAKKNQSEEGGMF